MKIINKIHSNIDDTIKYQLITDDNFIIEACIIFFNEESARINICISSQIGCSCNCSFCATGRKRFIRNLTFKEIIEQMSLITNDISLTKEQFFEITYMGTGEPLNNFDSVLESIKHFENAYPSLYRINISTILPHLDFPKILLTSTKKPIHFQYSMHFVDDELREKYFKHKLIPIQEALCFFNSIAQQTNNSFCVNYLLFDGINDSIKDAKKLIEMCKHLKCYIKISEYCPIEGSNLIPSKSAFQFTQELDKAMIFWKPFQNKGVDIKASCGHLLSDVIF